MKTAASETVIEMMVKPISRDPLSAASNRRLAQFDVAHDVFEDDDGVIDHKADGEGQGEEGEVVQAEAEEVHDHERADD